LRAAHFATNEPLQKDRPRRQVTQPEESTPEIDKRLVAWEVWLQELNFESYWDRDY
jgi:hypothetical protein